MQAVIMAGGKGTRFRSVTDIPKPLIDINGSSLLRMLIEHVKKFGVDNVIVCAGYKADKIKEYFDSNDFGIKITISVETEPLGTAGALNLVKDQLEEEFLVLYGDVYTTLNLGKMLKFHNGKNADATLLLHTSDHPQDSTVVETNDEWFITKFVEKPGDDWEKYGNLTSAALYVLKKEVVGFIDDNGEVDFAKDVFPKMLSDGRKLSGYVSDEYTKDIGTSERYEEVKEYDSSFPRGVAFLDRDGTVNKEVGLIKDANDLELVEGSAEGIKMLNDAGFAVVIVTNQPVIARGMIDEKGLENINDKLIEMLKAKGAKVDAVYYCPHHPEKNHPEANNPKYRRGCRCRKPETGMIEKATTKFKIDFGKSYVVGDKTSDVQLGKNSGCKGILLETGHAGKDNKYDVKADHVCKNLLEACKIIVDEK
jgi:mannose-1-phosphate guanylyltransferase / phosphomannomutase